jgi:ATP-dependent DNA helicase DinG
MMGDTASALHQAVLGVFAPEGPLAKVDTHFKPREGQTAMAMAVADTLLSGGALVVEAGTGVGKTFAYLVPALLSGERVVISTATKTLQDQLFSRDLPALIQALSLPTKRALLKGRANYLCLYRMGLAKDEGLFPDRYVVHLLGKVEKWAKLTLTGDLSELEGLDERSALIPMITSTKENCLGSDCPQFKSCHVALARREAMAADVVVINHHLFFADLSMKESGMAELLPNTKVVIFDEAHQLNETGVNFLGEQLSSSQLIDLARDLLALGAASAKGMGPWQALAARLEIMSKTLRGLFAKNEHSQKLSWIGAAPLGLDEQLWHDTMREMGQLLQELLDAVEVLVPSAPDWERYWQRVQDMQSRIALFESPLEPGSVRFADVAGSVRLIQAPLDIAKTLGPKVQPHETLVSSTSTPSTPSSQSSPSSLTEQVLGPQAQEGQTLKELETAESFAVQDSPKAWIFTSATLGADPSLAWFTQPCGLTHARVLQVKSPFNYARQAVLLVPKNMVLPSDPQHSQQVSELAAKVVGILGGKTLILTTTLRALKDISQRLKDLLKNRPEIEVLAQGESSKVELMQRFRGPSAHAEGGFVLVASASFWEGFDVPGDALQAVIIDKLPFPPPNDPMVQARSKRLESEGKSAFNNYFLAEAGVSLKQGAGRLIRRESDKGVLVVCDTRLSTTGYGTRLMAALPPMARVSDEQALLEGLKRLTKSATSSEA